MKKLAVVIITLTLLVSGCAYLTTAICYPTDNELTSFTNQIAQGNSLIGFYAEQPSTVPIQALISGLQVAVAVLIQAREGICVEQAALKAAQANVGQAGEVAKGIRAGRQLRLSR